MRRMPTQRSASRRLKATTTTAGPVAKGCRVWAYVTFSFSTLNGRLKEPCNFHARDCRERATAGV